MLELEITINHYYPGTPDTWEELGEPMELDYSVSLNGHTLDHSQWPSELREELDNLALAIAQEEALESRTDRLISLQEYGA